MLNILNTSAAVKSAMANFRNSILCEWNVEVGPLLVVNCKCYKQYKNDFDNCLNYCSCLYRPQVAVAHKCIPIVLGSYLDFLIRGPKQVLKDKPFWGCIRLRGMLYLYYTFTILDALSLHVVSYKNSKPHVELYMYCNQSAFALKYKKERSSWVYENRSYTSEEHGNSWIDVINKENGTTHSASVYEQLFEAMLKPAYDMNLIRNRLFITPAAAVKRFLEYSSKHNNLNLREHFEQGTIYKALCKNNQIDTKKILDSVFSRITFLYRKVVPTRQYCFYHSFRV